SGSLSMMQRLPVACALWTLLASAQGPAAPDRAIREINLMAGRGELLQYAHDIVKVVIAEPKIADAIVVSPREVMVNAKGAGHTTLIVWETGSDPARYDIAVAADTSEIDNWRRTLAAELHAASPDTAIHFSGNAESVVLTGTVANAAESKRAEAI